MKLRLTKILVRHWAMLCLSLGACSSYAAAEVAIIVHPNNQVSVSSADISNIFLGKVTSFPDGERATPVILRKGNPTRQEFISKVLSRSEAQYKAYWSRLIFTGQATPPLELQSSQAILEQVANNRDAIAFIDAKDVTGQVRVIQVY